MPEDHPVEFVGDMETEPLLAGDTLVLSVYTACSRVNRMALNETFLVDLVSPVISVSKTDDSVPALKL